MTVQRAAPNIATQSASPEIGPGTILVGGSGEVRVVRSRTADGAGWNCADGAAIADDVAGDRERWTAYTPERLAAALTLAEEVRQLGGQRELAGGLATWDACSGRPCVLPKLAKVVNRLEHPVQPDWLSTLD